MAKAPKPGAQRKQEEAQQGIRITLKGKHYDLYVDAVPLAVRMQVRKITDLSIEQIIAAPGLDTFAVVVWVVRMIGGEPGLDLEEVWADVQGVNEDDFDIEPLFPGSHPETEETDSPS